MHNIFYGDLIKEFSMPDTTKAAFFPLFFSPNKSKYRTQQLAYGNSGQRKVDCSGLLMLQKFYSVFER